VKHDGRAQAFYISFMTTEDPMNAYSAPAASAAEAIDFRDAVPNLAVKLAGFTLGAAGFFVSGSGLQLLAFFELSWGMLAAASMLLTLGSVSVLVAPFVIKGRSWASMLAVPTAAVMALTTMVWAVLSVSMLFFSPLVVVGALTSAAAALVAPFAVPGALRATRARNALYA